MYMYIVYLFMLFICNEICGLHLCVFVLLYLPDLKIF